MEDEKHLNFSYEKNNPTSNSNKSKSHYNSSTNLTDHYNDDKLESINQ